jgi:hypothetical protein
MSSTAAAIIGFIWLFGGLLGLVSFWLMGGAEKPELKWPFPFFQQLYNRRVHALATAFFVVGGLVFILIAVVS